MEKSTIAYLVSLKCAESNHYNSNCLLYQRCWLLCTCYGEYKTTRTCEDFKSAAPPRFYLFHSENSYVSKEYSFTIFSYVMRMVQRWKQCGPFMAP